MDIAEGNLRFRLPDGATRDSLTALIEEDYVLRQAEPAKAAVTFYDTFDWSLCRKSLGLGRTSEQWVVRCLPAGDALEHLTTSLSPSFATEIPDSPLKERIADIAGVRRLLPVGEAIVHTLPYAVLNADDKTVARLIGTAVWTQSRDKLVGSPEAAAAQPECYVELRPVRGYTGHLQRLAATCEEAGLTVSPWQETFERVVAAAGQQPGQYSAKPDYHLQPEMRADEAMKQILRLTLEVMRANEEGIKADWDIEFLHDYRTSVRRTRSALSQIPHVFPAEITERYKAAFALLGERTNQLRDLDVYLTSEPDYQAMFPDAMRDHIAPVFDYLRPQRQQALGEVIEHLNSPEYAAVIEAWEAFLDEPVPIEPAARNATVAIDELARQRIAKQYRRVIKDGNKVLELDEDALVHQLRIDCKKLRYLMEFFASLFPKKKINRLISTIEDTTG